MEKKVSVIIPVYNVEKYIKECLDSARNQTLQDIEILCVDDGSKDGSMDIVEECAREDSRIVILHKENGGLSSARNYGLAHATGEYVYFLDSDDWIDSNTLECLYTRAAEYGLDDIFFDAVSFAEGKQKDSKEQAHYATYYIRKHDYSACMTGLEYMVRVRHHDEYRQSACLQMPRRRFLVEQGITFKEGIVHEDNLFTFQVLLSASKVSHMGMPFYHRRVREDSIMTEKSSIPHVLGYYLSYHEAVDYAKTHCEEVLTNPEVLGILGRMYRNGLLELSKVTMTERENFITSLETEEQIRVRTHLNIVMEQNDKRQRERRKAVQDATKIVKDSATFRTGEKLLSIPHGLKTFVKDTKKQGMNQAFYRMRNRNRDYEKDLEHGSLKVSIIIPVYNAEKYLRDSLNGLLKQSLTNIEILCVNDGSTDHSLQILEEYSKRDSRIKIINQENAGAAAARNHGMTHAQGEYLLFLDADDLFEPDLCRDVYLQGVKDQADVVLFGAERMNVQNMHIEPMNWVLVKSLLPEKRPFSYKDIKDGKIFQITSGCPWSKMFKRSFVEQHKLQYQSLKNANDVLFVRTAMALAAKLTYVKQNYIIYRYNDGSNIQGQKKRYPLEFYKAYCGLKETLKEHGVYEKVERSYLNLALNDSLVNLQSVAADEEAYQLVKDTLVNEGFAAYGISECEPSVFYQEKDYEAYQSLIKK